MRLLTKVFVPLLLISAGCGVGEQGADEVDPVVDLVSVVVADVGPEAELAAEPGEVEAVWAVGCDEATAEAGQRRRAGTLDTPRRQEIDRDTVVIEEEQIADAVAQPEERPGFDDFPAVEEVEAANLDDPTLVRLVQLCRGELR
ncbi:MAG: hypothetical protein P8N02_17285 [Actinomycetota bacterium]|nr:hypothetical protein [Actinomycetota bacterium]